MLEIASSDHLRYSCVMIEPAQSRMARAALGWSAADLASQAGIGAATVSRFEAGTAKPIPATLSAMQRALEAAGVIFLAAGETADGGPGVRLRTTPSRLD